MLPEPIGLPPVAAAYHTMVELGPGVAVTVALPPTQLTFCGELVEATVPLFTDTNNGVEVTGDPPGQVNVIRKY